jgi:hypothetical protein
MIFVLTSLPWGENKPQGLADTLPIHGLWRYLGTNYLLCSGIDNTLKLISIHLVSNLEITKPTMIEETPFLMFLLGAYRNHDEYKKECALTWLQEVGEFLVTSSGRLATVASLEPITGEQHWVAIVISEGGKIVEYGDSLGREFPFQLQEIVIWWIQHHAPALSPSLSNLPIIQQIDGHSCGVLVVMAIHKALALPLPTRDYDPTTLHLSLFNWVTHEILVWIPSCAGNNSGEISIDGRTSGVVRGTVADREPEGNNGEVVIDGRTTSAVRGTVTDGGPEGNDDVEVAIDGRNSAVIRGTVWMVAH